MKNKCEHI